ncbi:MAG: acyl-CoA thioesterase [Oscillospiraceae bacterium]|nr:acyl-CoA thioesterase [Oscillospiraceae bacterium]
MNTPYCRQIHYYETDKMGIAHHSNHIRWLEEARLDYMKKRGISYVHLETCHILMPVVSVSCEYKKAVKFDDEITVEAVLSFFNGVRAKYEYRIYTAEARNLVAVGASEHCFIDEITRKPVSLKRAVPEYYYRMMQVAEDDKSRRKGNQ